MPGQGCHGVRKIGVADSPHQTTQKKDLPVKASRIIATIVICTLLPAGCVWKSDFEVLQEKQRKTVNELQDMRAQVQELREEKAACEGSLEQTQQELQRKIAQLEESLLVAQRRSKERLAKAKEELEAARREGSEAVAQAQARYEAVKEAAAEEISGLQGRLTEAQQKAEAAQKQIEQYRETYEALVGNLEEEVQSQQIKISQLRDELTIDLVDKVLFDVGSAGVNPQGRKVLKKVSDALEKIGDRLIVVEGHTDNLPIKSGPLAERYPTNWELSAARAVSVVRLLQDYGVDPKRMAAAAYGPYQPLAPNTTPEGRSKNRRIEIVLKPIPKPAEPTMSTGEKK